MLKVTYRIILLIIVLRIKCSYTNKQQCRIDEVRQKQAAERDKYKYNEIDNAIMEQIWDALKNHTPCSMPANDANCTCHSLVIKQDLRPYKSIGVTRQMIDNAAKYGTKYKIFNKRLYRDENCMFPARCAGIEYFLFELLPTLPNMDLIVNTRDWPQLNAAWSPKGGPVFSFSKTKDYLDIMYPAWTFWAGGPAISLHPTGIGRWDLMRENLRAASEKTSWSQKQPIGFFRGSRTSDERDTLILLSRQKPNLVNAQYTKNQAWKSPKDTLNATPAQEISFEDHCRYKYLFNFRGVAASFRLKHLFLCKSLVFHVGDEWQEFFYAQLKPWVHYVPLSSYPNEQEIEQLITFFRKHDDLAEQIAIRGYEFIWNHLRMQDIKCYWHKLLKKYAKLFKYEVIIENKLIEMTTTKQEL